MPDNGKIEPKVVVESSPEKPKDITLTITLTGEGVLSIQAPGNGQQYDEMLCDYLMKKASRYIEAHNFKAGQPKIQPRQPSMVERVRGMLNKGGR